MQTRNYEITTKQPFSFVQTSVHANNKGLDIIYTYLGTEYLVPLEVDNDEQVVTYCRVSNDSQAIYVDVTFKPQNDSKSHKITEDFVSFLGNKLPHIQNPKIRCWNMMAHK
jgi:hypothetical protein